MGKLIVNEFMSLDGVAQAPGLEDEDRSGGFRHGGWHMQFMEDELAMQWTTRSILEAAGFLLGRRTYEIFAAYWPNAPEEEQIVAAPLNAKPKWVASKTLTEPLDWQGSTLLPDDLAQAVTTLKEQESGDVHVIGSTQLVQALIENDLVDQYRLMIDPLALGGGKRFFPEDGALRPLQLVDSQVTEKGAILATLASG